MAKFKVGERVFNIFGDRFGTIKSILPQTQVIAYEVEYDTGSIHLVSEAVLISPDNEQLDLFKVMEEE